MTNYRFYKSATFKFLTFALFFIYKSNCYAQPDSNLIPSSISGIIKLDSTWSPKIYLSHIPSISKMYTMSKSMIIAETQMDSTGYFNFNISYLPKEDNLYRIHVSKINASPASLIIGGKDENHFFLVANKNSSINITNSKNKINSVIFNRDSQNKIIRTVDNIVKYIDSTNFSESGVKSEFVAAAFNEQLRKIADTCSYPLASLYALHKGKFEADILKNLEFYQSFSNKWKTENSTYFIDFRRKIPSQRKISDKFINVLIICFSFLLGFFFKIIFGKSRKKKSKQIKSLSIQERKIFVLLKEGKSNKEISEICNIGMSTVKSHVSSIYYKLNLKSRKEVIDL